MLYVDSDYGISCLYPYKGVVNRLGPTETQLMIPSTPTQEFNVDTKTPGREQLIVIAVKAQGQPIDFSAARTEAFGSGPSICERGHPQEPWAREHSSRRSAGLLNSGITGEATSRGLTVKEESEHAMVIVPFRVTPGKRVDVKNDKKE